MKCSPHHCPRPCWISNSNFSTLEILRCTCSPAMAFGKGLAANDSERILVSKSSWLRTFEIDRTPCSRILRKHVGHADPRCSESRGRWHKQHSLALEVLPPQPVGKSFLAFFADVLKTCCKLSAIPRFTFFTSGVWMTMPSVWWDDGESMGGSFAGSSPPHLQDGTLNKHQSGNSRMWNVRRMGKT